MWHIAYCDTFVIPHQCHDVRLSLYNLIEWLHYPCAHNILHGCPRHRKKDSRSLRLIRTPEHLSSSIGRLPNGFLGLSLNDRTIISLMILLDKTVSVGWDSLSIRTLDWCLPCIQKSGWKEGRCCTRVCPPIPFSFAKSNTLIIGYVATPLLVSWNGHTYVWVIHHLSRDTL